MLEARPELLCFVYEIKRACMNMLEHLQDVLFQERLDAVAPALRPQHRRQRL